MTANNSAHVIQSGGGRYGGFVSANTSAEPQKKPQGWEGVVRELVSTLRFGVVQITVHESQVVQVERTEKVRFAQSVSHKPNR